MRPPARWYEWLAALVGRIRGRQSYQQRINGHVLRLNTFVRELAARTGTRLLDLHPLLSSRNGVLRQDFTWQAIQALPSFVGLKQWARVGDTLRVTTDLQTALGTVGLYSPTFERLLEDCRRIREIEAEFFADERAVVPA